MSTRLAMCGTRGSAGLVVKGQQPALAKWRACVHHQWEQRLGVAEYIKLRPKPGFFCELFFHLKMLKTDSVFKKYITFEFLESERLQTPLWPRFSPWHWLLSTLLELFQTNDMTFIQILAELWLCVSLCPGRRIDNSCQERGGPHSFEPCFMMCMGLTVVCVGGGGRRGVSYYYRNFTKS